MVNTCALGKQQSPINIKSKTSIKCGALCDLTFYYRTSKCNLLNTKKELVIDYDNGSYVMYNSNVYELDKLSFSIPASHKIDGYSFPVEVQLYHRSPDTGGILIVSVFLDVNDATSRSSYFLQLFNNSIPKKAGNQILINTPESWTAYDILPENKSFFTYTGSLPRSPCTENVTWIILDSPSNCSTNFYTNLQRTLSSNARSIQRLNGRKIYYNPNTADKNKRNYGDKLRCYSEKEFRKSCAAIVGNKEIMSQKYKNTIFLTTAGCIFVSTVLFILWLVQQDFFSSTAAKVKNIMAEKIFIPKKIE